ncbi:MAG: glycosyltransferase, partial [Spirochaetaceae bacterium]
MKRQGHKAKKASPVYTVVIPVYNEEDCVRACHKELTAVMASAGEAYELVFVNDGSRDNTLPLLHEISALDRHVKVLSFSRNFGHQAAVSAGIDFACGHAVIVIDADLQDPPDVIPVMIAKWKQGFHVVYGKRIGRKGDSFFKRITAALFYRVLRRFSGISIPLDSGDFRLMDRKVCDAIKRMPERHRFLRGLVAWTGFRQTSAEYIRQKRRAGKTKYPLFRMINFAADAITAFSRKPLQIASWIGFLTSAGGFGYFIYSLVRYFNGETAEGWTSIVSLLIIFNGILFIILGIMGAYLGRIFDEVKGRPL